MLSRFNRCVLAVSMLVLVLTATLWARASEKTMPVKAAPAAATEKETSDSADTFKQLTLFSDVLERVRSDYVDTVTDDKLIETALNGMLSSLDPHSGYMNKKNFEEMQTQTRGAFGGLGIEVTMENNIVKVVSPIDDTPAAKAGVQPGDWITHIDNKPVMELTLSEAVDRMRGTPGTKVTLTIRRGSLSGQPMDITLVRAIIHIQSVKWEQKGDVAYIRITTFNEQTQSGLDKALEESTQKMGAKLSGYVVDLRNNPGGLLEQAVSVAGTFLEPEKDVVSTRGRHKDDDQVFRSKGGDRTHGKPIVVLINGGSASASEIVSGALQDHKRAILIGTKSFGKGSVQTIIPINGGAAGAMRLTTSRYYTPSGRSIQALGIEPDIVVQQAKLEKIAMGPDLHEADLKGALQNDTIKKEKSEQHEAADESSPASETTESADKVSEKASEKPGKKTEPFDYQLARALDLVHGIHIFQSKKGD